MEENHRPRPMRPPSMDWLLSLPQVVEAERLYGREAVKEELRRAIAAGQTDPVELAPSAPRAPDPRFTPTLFRAVNSTRALLHTNPRRARSPDAALLLTVPPSNYEIRGYTRRPLPVELAALAREAKIPWVHDHGTGSVVPLDEFGVAGEATVASCLADGADAVTFSADKLFAGPQAGFIAGRTDLVGRLAAHPVARVVRPDKLTLAALAATIAAWKTGKWREFPIYRAAGQSLEQLEERGEKIRDAVRARERALSLEIVPATAFFGGGTSPDKPFPSRALTVSLPPTSTEDLSARLRGGTPPIVARIEDGRLLLDLRSIAPSEDAEVIEALARLTAETPGPAP